MMSDVRCKKVFIPCDIFESTSYHITHHKPMDPWSTLGAATSFLSTKDVTYSQVLAAQKALKLLADNKELVKPIVELCLACSNNDVYTIKELLTEDNKLLNTIDSKGLTPLIYAICFHNKECVELLLTFNVDCNEPDNLVGWTPVMWATHMDFEDLIERLVSFNADPMKKVGKSMKNAIDLVKPNSKAYEYYKIHGYIKDKSVVDSQNGDDFYKNDFISDALNNSSASLPNTTMKDLSINNDFNTNKGGNKFVDNEDVVFDENTANITFNFNVVQSKQYIKFSDDSIRGIMDFIFKLSSQHHTKPLYPSSILFQCLRYAEHKLQSEGMVKNLVDLYLTRIRKITDTKSGVVKFFGEKEKKEREKRKKKEKDTTPDPPSIDIVTIGYWISALNHLYYFLIRDSACYFLSKYPLLLQEIISCLQSLISKLAFTLDARLEPLLEPCILQYNSVPDFEVIYKNDWKIFKNRSKTAKKTSYEEIMDMLYPPSYTEQMKPSPLRVIQTLGALLYVLELFYINDVIKQQCLSAVLYYIGCHLFNKVIANKKYCSRVKAMEIRLNLSYIQDWLRSNNLQPFIEEDATFETVLSWKGDGFPDSVVDKPTGYLSNVCRFEGDERNPFDATYYLNPLYKIGQYSLQPIVELAEWLQVMTGIRDLESLKDIFSKFEILASSTMVQCIRNYHYEVDEKKFSKTLKKWLKENQHNESLDMVHKGMFYKDDSKLELNAGQAFPVTLPKLVQLLHQYGADFKHVDNKKLMAYQPYIPLEIRDELETMIDECNEEHEYHRNSYTDDEQVNQNYSEPDDYENEESESASHLHSDRETSPSQLETNPDNSIWSDVNDNATTTTASVAAATNTTNNTTTFASSVVNTNSTVTSGNQGTERGGKETSDLFRELSMPGSLAKKPWQDDSNPWA